MDIFIAAEPGQLALAIAAGEHSHLVGGFFDAALAVQSGDEFLIANGLHGGAFGWDAAGKKLLNFFDQSTSVSMVFTPSLSALSVR